jgi:hypothetical protein
VGAPLSHREVGRCSFDDHRNSRGSVLSTDSVVNGMKRRFSLWYRTHLNKILFDNWTVSERFHDLIQTGVEFMLIDLDLAMTFMDVAEGSRLEDTKHRNHKNARKAYDAVLQHLEKLKPDARQRRVIDAMLARLKTRLETAGEQF